jgi:anti-anti-sigma factor
VRRTIPLPQLDAILGAGVGRQPLVVVDLMHCDFMDPSGLQVIAGEASRLSAWGATLVLRSPSGIVRRLTPIMGLTDLIEAEQAPAHRRPIPVPP